MSYAWERYDGPEIPDGVELHESIARACLPDLKSVTELEPFIQWLCTPVTGESSRRNVFIAGRLAVINDEARLREVQGFVNELAIISGLDQVSLVNGLIHAMRDAVVLESRLRRVASDILDAFEPDVPRCQSFGCCRSRISRGVEAAFTSSSESEISSSLAPLAGGCLCWGTAASIAAPTTYDAYSTDFFDVLRITGSSVDVAELFVKVSTRCFAVASKLTQSEIHGRFSPEAYVRYGDSSGFVFVLPPITLSNGIYVKGAVWCAEKKHHRYGTILDLGESGDLVPISTEKRLRDLHDPESCIFQTCRMALESYGVEADPSQFIAVCYESAIIEHLRSLGPEVFSQLFATLDVPTVPAFMCWNQSGEIPVSGHVALAVPQVENDVPVFEAPPTIVTSNMHFMLRNVTLSNARIGALIASDQHAGRVLAAWLKRVDLVRPNHNDPLRSPGADVMIARRQVWIGSKWTHEERRKGLKRIFIHSIALRQIQAIFMRLDENAYVRPLREIELFDELSDAELENVKRQILRARRRLERLRDAGLWTVRDFTPRGAFKRLLRESRMRTIRAPFFAEKRFGDLDAKPAFYFCCVEFFGSVFSSHGLADKDFQCFLRDAISGNVEEEQDVDVAVDDDETDDALSRHVIEGLSQAYEDEELEAARIGND